MKATMLASTAIAGAVVWMAGVSAQPPAVKPLSPPPANDLPAEDPTAKPAPRALRKKEAVERPAPLPEEPAEPPRAVRKKEGAARPAPLPDDDAPSPAKKPMLKTPAAVPGTFPDESTPLPTAKKPAATPAEEEEENVPGTATVRRRGGVSKPRTAVDLTPDASRKTEQSLSLEWSCPANIKTKVPFLCEMIVRNNGLEPAVNVVVKAPTPDGFKMLSSEPKPTPEADMVTWNLGTIGGRQERRVRIEMTAERRGELACKATVTASTATSTQLRVIEPQLVIKQSCPEKVMIGDSVPVTITVSNPGDGPTDPIVVRAKMTEGLKGDKGQEMVNDVGVLAAGESRILKLVCHTIRGGPQKIVTTALAEGLNSAAESKTAVSEPRMEISMSGPKMRYLDRSATYTVVLSNPGDATAHEVKLHVAVPGGFKAPTPASGGKYDAPTRTISWTIGALNPGEKKEFSYRSAAGQLGDHKHMAMAEAAHGLKGSSDVVTKVEGIASLLVEMADVDDPIEVGAETSYEVRVTNHGSAPATNVEIRALVPKQMAIKTCLGPTEYKVEGQEVIYAPIPKLAPKADAVFRITVKANGIGDVRFRARLSSDSLAEPVIGEEGTKVYSDKS